jgi:hypothetical protein
MSERVTAERIVPAVTVERIERAIRTVADMMVKHDRQRLVDTIKRFLHSQDPQRN